MDQIIIKKLTMQYDSYPVVCDVSFTIKQGEYVCIIGENGAGKSTMLKGILGLKPIKSGAISINMPKDKKAIGYMPQQTDIQRDFPASVYEVVLSGCLCNKKFISFYNKTDKQRALDSLDKLGIMNLRHKSYRNLSGGQQQRVLLARALASNPGLLALDEPLTGLDPAASLEFYSMLRKINKEQGITILMTSHDIHSAMSQSDKILHLSHKLEFFGTPEEYLKNDISKKFVR